MIHACIVHVSVTYGLKVCTRIFINEIDELYYKHEFCMYRNSLEDQLYFKHEIKKLPREKMFITRLVYVQGIHFWLKYLLVTRGTLLQV